MRRILGKLALSVVATGLVLGASELVLRAVDGAWTSRNFSGIGEDFDGWRGNFHASALPWVPDAELGWLPESGLSGSFEAWGGARLTTVDGGIRSSGRPGEHRSGDEERPAVVAVGDSFTFCNQVSDDETWPAQLEALSGVTVVNAGVFGFGVDQIYWRAQQMWRQYRPRVLIFSLIPEDIHRCEFCVSFGVRKPYYTVVEGRLVLRDQPVPPQRRPGRGAEVLRGLFGHSYMVHRVMHRFDPTFWYTGRRNLRAEDRGERRVAGAAIACLLMQEIEVLAADPEVDVVVLIQYSWIDDEMQRELVAPLLRCLDREVIHVFDLANALYAVRARDPATYTTFFDGHMTAVGNRFVAEELFRFMVGRDLLEDN